MARQPKRAGTAKRAGKRRTRRDSPRDLHEERRQGRKLRDPLLPETRADLPAQNARTAKRGKPRQSPQERRKERKEGRKLRDPLLPETRGD